MFLAISLWTALQQPYTGLSLSSDPTASTARVRAGDGPAVGVVSAGELLAGVRRPGGVMVPLDGRTLRDEPGGLATFEEYNLFLDRQREIAAMLRAGAVELIAPDRSAVSLVPQPTRPVLSLPWHFWFIHLVATLTLLVSAGVYGRRRRDTASRLVALAGLGYGVALASFSVYATRDLGLPATVFHVFSAANAAGSHICGTSLVLLAYYYPRRVHPFPGAYVLGPLAAAHWVITTFQLAEPPIHAYELPYLPSLLMALTLCGIQWRRTANAPLARATLRWMALTSLVSIGLINALFFVPNVLKAPPLIPAWSAILLPLGVFSGVVLGILRYRLFDIERWWVLTWVWMASGLAFVAVDLTLVVFLGARTIEATALALVGCAWAYLPLRQWAFARVFGLGSAGSAAHMQALVSALVGASSADEIRVRFTALLENVFSPAQIEPVRRASTRAQILDDGLMMEIPDCDPNRTLELRGKRQGRSLFSRHDAQVSEAMLTLARESYATRKASELAARGERERIMRDLHDDVGAVLLQLRHRSNSVEIDQLVTAALRSLQDVVYALSDPGPQPLDDVLADCRAEANDRVEDAGVSVVWTSDPEVARYRVGPKLRSGLARILREAVSNALRHGRPSTIEVIAKIEDQWLSLTVADDGLGRRPDRFVSSTGLASMRTRAQVLGGEIHWSESVLNGRCGIRVSTRLPLGELL